MAQTLYMREDLPEKQGLKLVGKMFNPFIASMREDLPEKQGLKRLQKEASPRPQAL